MPRSTPMTESARPEHARAKNAAADNAATESASPKSAASETVTRYLMGNEAMAHAALEAGVAVVAGYPGTPSSELVERVAWLHAEGAAEGVWVEWSTNEKTALEVAAGASLSGARALMTCKQMGLNVASDALMSLNYLGVRGGVVLYVADDPGPISSQTEQDTRRYAAFAKAPVLDPATPEQGAAMMRAAFDLSERYETPVIVRPTTRICHASTFYEVAAHTMARAAASEGFEKDPRWVIFPARSYAAHREINERLAALARAFGAEEPWRGFNPIETVGDGTPELGIVCGGISVAYAREAIERLREVAREAGITPPTVRLFAVGTPYPFPADRAAEFARGLARVLVLEELDSVLEEEMLKLAGRTYAPWVVKGKLTASAPDRGENSVETAGAAIAALLDRSAAPWREATGTLSQLWRAALHPERVVGAHAAASDESIATAPPRPPVLCAGCPHRASFSAVKRALDGRAAVLCGDIGCYTLGNAAPLDAVDTCLCMGAGITMAQGIATVSPDQKAIAFVGDSTYFASGLTGVANAVYNGHDVTIFVLDNATTAMTGLQPHPGTGVTLMGERRRPISIEETLRALGVATVRTADPFAFDEAVAVARSAIDAAGPAAVIFQAPCIQLHPPAPPLTVDPAACTGCRRCLRDLGCPAIAFDPAAVGPRSRDRGQALVVADLCTGCGLCGFFCPSSAFVAAGADGEANAVGDGGADAAATAGVVGEADSADAADAADDSGAADEEGAHV